jgi:hypothetical protein
VPTAQHAARLRGRADDLRRLARNLENVQLTNACSVAGDDTWVGPTPQACADDLRRLARQLLIRGAELRDAARRLDRAADAINAELLAELMAERAMTAAAPAGVR